MSVAIELNGRAFIDEAVTVFRDSDTNAGTGTQSTNMANDTDRGGFLLFGLGLVFFVFIMFPLFELGSGVAFDWDLVGIWISALFSSGQLADGTANCV